MFIPDKIAAMQTMIILKYFFMMLCFYSFSLIIIISMNHDSDAKIFYKISLVNPQKRVFYYICCK